MAQRLFTLFLHHNETHGYDNKQSDGEALVLEILGMWSTPSLPSDSAQKW